MKLIKNLSKEKYEEFVKKHKNNHFLQSYAWGEFSKKEKNLIPHYIGLSKDNKLISTALVLEKKLPLGLCYFYIPRGFTIDYTNEEALKTFTQELKLYAKEKKAIFIKIDPAIIYNKEDTFGNKIVEKNSTEKEILEKIGYKHLGFTKNFETMQPRYTFRIDMNKSWEELENNFSKTTKQRIKKAQDFFVEVKIGDKEDIKTFYDLMMLTESRKDFVTHNEQYYQSLYEIWNKDNSCNLFLGIVNLDKIIKRQSEIEKELKIELSNLPTENLSKSQNTKKNEIEKRLNKITSDITRYKSIKDEYGNKLTLSAHFIIEYADKAWVLYAGNHNILTDTYANYETYKEHIKHYYDNETKIYDQFGTIGDLNKDNPLLGLHEFKKKFGGDYVEFIGEFDYVIKPIFYVLFTKLIPLYRNFIKTLAKRKNKKSSN